MDQATLKQLICEVITDDEFRCELVLVQEGAWSWRVTVRNEGHRLISFDVQKGMTAHIRDVVRAYLEIYC